MHVWGDEWFERYGNDLYAGIKFCMRIWVRYGRIGTHGKEKYGTFRDHVYLYSGYWPLHELIKPGHVGYRWPRWMMRIESKVLSPIVQALRIPVVIRAWQALVYNYAVQKACKRYPAVMDELVSHLDGYAMVKPGLFGNVDGQAIHDKYWVSI